MSRLKQAVYASNDIDEIDITPEGLDELEAQGGVLVLDWKTFAREYRPEADMDEPDLYLRSECCGEPIDGYGYCKQCREHA